MQARIQHNPFVVLVKVGDGTASRSGGDRNASAVSDSNLFRRRARCWKRRLVVPDKGLDCLHTSGSISAEMVPASVFRIAMAGATIF
jgi:hypothetical protein